MTINAVVLDKARYGPAQLSVSGVVGPEGSSFGLGFAVHSASSEQALVDVPALSSVAVDLIDAGGTVLTTSVFALRSLCNIPRRDDLAQLEASYLVAGSVTLMDDVRRMVVRDEKETLLDRPFPKAAPRLGEIYAKPSEGSRFEVDWRASHPEGAALEHVVLVRYDPSAAWQPVSLPTTDTAQTVTVNPPLGTAEFALAVMTTDGLNTVIAETSTLAAQAQHPELVVVSPAPGPTAPDVGLRIVCSHDVLSASGIVGVWTSNVDGVIATGLQANATLSLGQHQLTVQLTDATKAVLAQASVIVDVT